MSVFKDTDTTSQWATLRAMKPYVWPRDRRDLQRRVVIAIVMLVLAKVLTVYVPFFYKWAVDALSQLDKTGTTTFAAVPVAIIVAYGVGRVTMALFQQLRDALFAKVGQHAVRVLAVETFEHMHRLSLRFHLQRRTGGLSRVITRGRDGIETIVRHILLNAAPTLLEMALVAGILFWHFSVWYVLIVAVTIVSYVGFTLVASEWRIAIRRAMNESDNDASAKAIDSLLNYETVKYFGNEAFEAHRFDQSMERYERASIRTYTSLAFLNGGQAIIFTAGLTASMVLAGYDVARGALTVGDFVLINSMLIQLYIPLNFIGMLYREIKQGLIDIEAMFLLLNRDPEIKDRADAVPLVVSDGEIRFDNVHFAYDPDRQILKGVSFTVPPGRTLAIVGPSGAGKSTISRLLFRFYEVTGGRILVDGQDIRDVTQSSLRATIGMVPQDTVLFNDTIAYNIRYGRPGASEDEVKEAARLAQIDGFIAALPQGFATEVGERGLKLSGGEKQRVAIARTILKSPPILMLDEATSALDTQTERGIQAALNSVSRGRTTLVIAHRLSTVIDADEIIVLEAGKVVERGRHDTLLARRGVYADMWNRQREAEEARERLKQTGDADIRQRPPEVIPAK